MQSLIILFPAICVVALGTEKKLLVKGSSEEEQLRLDMAFHENSFHGSTDEVHKHVPILFCLFVCMSASYRVL